MYKKGGQTKTWHFGVQNAGKSDVSVSYGAYATSARSYFRKSYWKRESFKSKFLVYFLQGV